MGLTSDLRRSTSSGARRRARRELRLALGKDPGRIRRRAHVDPHWRRLEDGGAARLAPAELIAPGRPIGRWHGIDPHRPLDGWRSISKVAGLLGWAGVVGGAWWLGASRGWGPLASVAELDRLGDTVGAALDGFSELP